MNEETTSLSDFKFLRQQPLPDQIASYLREEIGKGNFKPGMKLPTTGSLAVQWKTNVATVHEGMKALVKEGLITRIPRIGTFVQKREEKLTCVGIYHTRENWTKGSSDFERALHAALADELDEMGVEVQVWIDPRPALECDMPWKEMIEASKARKIQALISVPPTARILGWQNELPIPSAYLATTDIPNKVQIDLRQLAELSLRSLAEQGCHSVGVIYPLPVDMAHSGETRHPYLDFYESFIDKARDLGLMVRNEWVRIGSFQEHQTGMARQQHFGYEEFLKLWDQPEKPEGLVVFPDTTASGVILGLREKNVRVPKDLKLVFHKNEACDYFCPLPVSFAVFSEREAAHALIQQVQKQFNGESCEPVSLSFKLVAHENLNK